jgi:hypothetical protein
LEAGQGDQGNEDGQDPIGYKPKEQFPCDGQTKKPKHGLFHESSILFFTQFMLSQTQIQK